MNTKPGKLWGSRHAFERNYLQRTMTLISLGGVFAVTVILLVHADVTTIFGISLICGGLVSALAAASRHQYVQETRLGFVILTTRGGRFMFGSALACAVVGVLVALLVLLE